MTFYMSEVYCAFLVVFVEQNFISLFFSSSFVFLLGAAVFISQVRVTLILDVSCFASMTATGMIIIPPCSISVMSYHIWGCVSCSLT